ncbi:prepilin-type N-terminal cleavage/methylation domain-containing protein [bacterium]|nr:prepilin-type N-terminal cleavage/methylation domain-containing protein [bacterium]
MRHLRKGLSLVEFMIVVAILGILVAIIGGNLGGACAPVNGVKSVAGRYDVVGTVLGQPGTKMFGGDQGNQTKYSVKLKTDTGTTIVNCTSTQCSSLSEDDHVKLSCFNEVHVGEPNEVECRFDSLLPAQ